MYHFGCENVFSSLLFTVQGILKITKQIDNIWKPCN